MTLLYMTRTPHNIYNNLCEVKKTNKYQSTLKSDTRMLLWRISIVITGLSA